MGVVFGGTETAKEKQHSSGACDRYPSKEQSARTDVIGLLFFVKSHAVQTVHRPSRRQSEANRWFHPQGRPRRRKGDRQQACNELRFRKTVRLLCSPLPRRRLSRRSRYKTRWVRRVRHHHNQEVNIGCAHVLLPSCAVDTPHRPRESGGDAMAARGLVAGRASRFCDGTYTMLTRPW